MARPRKIKETTKEVHDEVTKITEEINEKLKTTDEIIKTINKPSETKDINVESFIRTYKIDIILIGIALLAIVAGYLVS